MLIIQYMLEGKISNHIFREVELVDSLVIVTMELGRNNENQKNLTFNFFIYQYLLLNQVLYCYLNQQSQYQ